MKLRVVILAAGASRRLGEPKALATIGARTALEHLLDGAHAIDTRPLVIAGAHAAELLARMPPGSELCVNERWELGRSTSVALAARLSPSTDLCIAPIDVPLVERAVFEALAAAWRAQGDPPRGFLAPRSLRDGRHGHPVIVGRDLLCELEELSPLRELRRRAQPLCEVPVDSAAILDDLDTPLDLERLRARHGATLD